MTEYIFKDLKDKGAVITGGGGVIGQSLSLAMGKAGMKIAIMDKARTPDKHANSIAIQLLRVFASIHLVR